MCGERTNDFNPSLTAQSEWRLQGGKKGMRGWGKRNESAKITERGRTVKGMKKNLRHGVKAF